MANLLHAFPEIPATKPCYDRVQKFLLEGQVEDKRNFSGDILGQDKGPDTDGPPKAISVTDLRLDIPTSSAGAEINFSVPKGSVCMISGPVGCGKSTLLKTILGEKMLKSGSIHVERPYIGYCGQQPWIQNCSIKANIVGVSELDESWYVRVINICDLEADLSQMSKGDETSVGSRGLSLSGGQKHRVVSICLVLFFVYLQC